MNLDKNTLDSLLDTAINAKWLDRLKAKDVSLWSEDDEVQKKIANRLGWLESAEWISTKLDEIKQFRDEILSSDIDTIVLLGMGGSSLAPEVFNEILLQSKGEQQKLKFLMLDDTAPTAIADIRQQITVERTLFIVSSKSGSTIETDAFFKYFYAECNSLELPGNQFIAITDEGTLMHETAQQLAFRKIFVNPSDIGGRFSSLSYFGVVPAALIGVDVDQLIAGAIGEYNQFFQISADENQVLKVALQMAALALNDVNKIIINYESSNAQLAFWIDQLIAESTGKDGKGILPVPYFEGIKLSDDAYFCNVYNTEEAIDIGLDGWDIQWSCHGWAEVGRDYLRWQLITAVIGIALEINPFDEPDVTVAKVKTQEILDNANKAKDKHPDNIGNLEALISEVGAQLSHVDMPYVGISLYGDDKDKVTPLFQELQQSINTKFNVQTVFNIGPRYLHSSGQLHKGGKNQGVFIVATIAHSQKADVPERKYDFNQLNRAQSLGEISALVERDRKVIWLDFSSTADCKFFFNNV